MLRRSESQPGVVGSARHLPADSAPAQESVKIEPYTGKPIFLEEPEKVDVAPTIVTKETIKEKLGDGRVEREVAHYSDNSFAADGSYKEFHPNGKRSSKASFAKAGKKASGSTTSTTAN